MNDWAASSDGSADMVPGSLLVMHAFRELDRRNMNGRGDERTYDVLCIRPVGLCTGISVLYIGI